MQCHVHPGREAYALCVECGKPACPECLISLHGQEYCRTCLEARIAPGAPPPPPPSAADPGLPPPRDPTPPPPPSRAPSAPPAPREHRDPTMAGKNEALATILALFPGLGHLYLGLRNRGLQLMVAFIGAIILAGFLGLEGVLQPWLTFVGIFFSVFDAREAMARMGKGLPVTDQPLFNMDFAKDNQKLLAYGLIVVGALALFRTLVVEMFRVLMPYAWGGAMVERTVLAVLLILGGVYLLRGGFGSRRV